LGSPFFLSRMITIDQFRISDDASEMFIDAHVNQASYFDGMYIGDVTVATDE